MTRNGMVASIKQLSILWMQKAKNVWWLAWISRGCAYSNMAAIQQVFLNPKHNKKNPMTLKRYLWIYKYICAYIHMQARHVSTSCFFCLYIFVYNIKNRFLRTNTPKWQWWFFFPCWRESYAGGNEVSAQPVALLRGRQPVNQQGGTLPRSGKAVT